MYRDWAEGQCEKIRGILNAARKDHTQAVKERIESVKGMEGVVDTTRAMFEVSKVSKFVFVVFEAGGVFPPSLLCSSLLSLLWRTYHNLHPPRMY